jgi:hypothetical protein
MRGRPFSSSGKRWCEAPDEGGVTGRSGRLSSYFAACGGRFSSCRVSAAKLTYLILQGFHHAQAARVSFAFTQNQTLRRSSDTGLAKATRV